MRLSGRASAVAILGLTFAMAGLLRATPADAQNVVGSVTRMSGSAQVLRAGATLNAAPGMALQLHDRVTTSAGADLTITLADGSTLELGESAVLVIDESVVAGGARASTKVSLFGGTLSSIVTAALRGATPNFEVHTPNATAGVRGTSFTTKYSSAESRPGYSDCNQFTDVAVDDGAVAVTNVGGVTVEVDAGYETTVPCLGTPLTPGPIGLTGAGFETAGPASGAAPVPACPVCTVGH